MASIDVEMLKAAMQNRREDGFEPEATTEIAERGLRVPGGRDRGASSMVHMRRTSSAIPMPSSATAAARIRRRSCRRL